MILLLLLVQEAGIEIGYRAKATKEVVDILRKRLDTAGLQRCTLAGDVDGLLLARIPGGTPEEAATVKSLLGRRGLLEFRLTADHAMQAKFVKDGVVPEGWEAVANPNPRTDGEYAAWGSPKILVFRRSAIEGGRILSAEASSQLFPGAGRDWYVAFDLDPVGARLFDEAAAVLYERRPPGLLAIVLDGQVRSAPAVQAPKLGGSGRITGMKGEKEAKDLAITLSHGPLPAPLGEPAFERRY